MVIKRLEPMGGRWALEEQKSMEVEVFLVVGGSDGQRPKHETWNILGIVGTPAMRRGDAGTKSLEVEAFLEVGDLVCRRVW